MPALVALPDPSSPQQPGDVINSSSLTSFVFSLSDAKESPGGGELGSKGNRPPPKKSEVEGTEMLSSTNI